jgi:hypothetical protein
LILQFFARALKAQTDSQSGAKMRNCGCKRLGRGGNGIVKNDKMQDLAGPNALAAAPLHFGNAPTTIRSFARNRESRT